MQKTFSPLLQISLCTFGCLYAISDTVLAQVTPDGTVNTQVNQNGNVVEITGGEARGSNLFHSFQSFSVPTNNEAFFNNAVDVSSIFSRVTGGNISNIDGLISANGSANLFLINPAGIIFGENASLNIGGSFYGSTASSILFENGEFSATDLENPPLLTVNAPVGLGFRDNPGDIVYRSINQSNTEELGGLDFVAGATLALVGGNIRLDGTILNLDGGQILLGGLTEAGTVELNENGSLNFPNNVSLADVVLAENSLLNINASNEGNIIINAENLELSGESNLFVGILRGEEPNTSETGNIDISVESINLQDSSTIQVSTFGQGDTGDILTLFCHFPR